MGKPLGGAGSPYLMGSELWWHQADLGFSEDGVGGEAGNGFVSTTKTGCVRGGGGERWSLTVSQMQWHIEILHHCWTAADLGIIFLGGSGE